MIGKMTRANVEEYAHTRGLELIQVDGIPDGFAWIEPDITIGNKFIQGKVVIFKPLAKWGDEGTIIKRQRTIV